MFEFLRKTPAQRPGRTPTTVGARSHRARLKFECLEPRCLLFAAPTTVGDSLDLHALPAFPAEGVPPHSNVSLESRSANIIRPAIPEHLPLLPHQPPLEGTGHRYVPQVPSGGYLNPLPSPAAPLPDTPPPDSSLGGLTDIGELDNRGGPAGTLSGNEQIKDVREVLELLAALQYVPSADQNVGDSLLDTLAADIATVTPAVASGESFHLPQVQGGMIGLVRDTLTAEAPGDDHEPAEGAELPLGVSIQMDGVYGRFQAFEVSTAEALPQTPTAPPARRELISLPNAADDAMPPSSEVDAAPRSPVDAAGVAPAFSSPYESSASDAPPAALRDASGETASRTLRAAAAAVFLAYAASATRSVDVRKPDRHTPWMRRLWLVLRWKLNIAKWLVAAKNLLYASVGIR